MTRKLTRDELDKVDAMLNRLFKYMDKWTYNQYTWDRLEGYWRWFVVRYPVSQSEAWLDTARRRLDLIVGHALVNASHSPATKEGSFDVCVHFWQTFTDVKATDTAAFYSHITDGDGIFNYIKEHHGQPEQS